MQRACFKRNIKPERIGDYLKVHENVWPDVLEAHRRAGMHNFSLFLERETGMVVGYFEAEDPLACIRILEKDPRCQAWEKFMADYLVTSPDNPDRRTAQWLEHYFYLE